MALLLYVRLPRKVGNNTFTHMPIPVVTVRLWKQSPLAKLPGSERSQFIFFLYVDNPRLVLYISAIVLLEVDGKTIDDSLSFFKIHYGEHNMVLRADSLR